MNTSGGHQFTAGWGGRSVFDGAPTTLASPKSDSRNRKS